MVTDITKEDITIRVTLKDGRVVDIPATRLKRQLIENLKKMEVIKDDKT